MPVYEVLGYGRETGERKRHVFVAVNEDAAIDLAANHDTVVERVMRANNKPRLMPCAACNNTISVSAASCPHCGEPGIAFHDGPEPPSAVVVQNQPPQRQWSPGIAAVLSFLIPGMGQMYKGQIFNGLLWLIIVAVGYFFLIIPGLVLHLICIIAATTGDPYRQ